jgi:hypothetical protein
MPDTGSPWNIPYVENADLVSDWPADSLLVANAVAAGLSAAGPAGIGSSVVQAVKTDVFSSTSTSNVDIPDVTVTITPTASASKILILATGTVSNNGANTVHLQLVRDSTDIGSASGGSSAATFVIQEENGSFADGFAIVFLDSPATTSATTYKLQGRALAGTFYVGRGPGSDRRGITTITAIEVAA